MSGIRGINRLIDISTGGREHPWDDKKRLCQTIALAVGDSHLPEDLQIKAHKIGMCADNLQYRQSDDTGEKELDSVWFCRQRLCPMCSWRLSLRRFANLLKAMGHLQSDKFVFLTLTVKNCRADELRKTINEIRKAFVRMYNHRLKHRTYKTKPSGGFCKGFYYTVEVTYNHRADTYHPHMHILLDVTSSYFSREYMSIGKWKELWREYLGVDYLPQADARVAHNGDMGGPLELSRYLTKSSDFFTYDDLEYTAKQFEILDRELSAVRTTATAGTFRQAFRDLKLENDIENADLIHGDGKITEGYVLKRYRFNGSYYELQ